MQTVFHILNIFNRTAAPLSEAEQALESWGIKYEKQPDGTLFVPGTLDLSSEGLTKLPDLSSVAVGGDFDCSYNQLTSLEGAPHTVGGKFSCYDNQLTSLDHAPQTVGGGFFCYDNQLTSLDHAPQSVGGGFYCFHNRLTSLEGAPQTVTGDFYCSNNQLTSLDHAPQSVGGHFSCSYNQLTSLEGAPQTVGGDFSCSNNQLTSLEYSPTILQRLKSDFGEYLSWDAVPEELRTSPETKARLEQERLTAATVLQSAMHVRGPLSFKRPMHAG